MRTIVSSEFFSLVDLSNVTHVVAVQAGAPDGECIELWPAAHSTELALGAYCPYLRPGHEVLVEVVNLHDPAAVLRLEILARSSMSRGAVLRQ